MACLTLASLDPSIRIDPERLMGMLLWGIVCGIGLGLVWDVIRITRVLLGVNYPSRGVGRLYACSLPLLGKKVSRPSATEMLWQRILRGAAILTEDFFFGILWGIVMTLLIYFTNDGIPRAMAPVGMLSGFLLYYHTVGRLVLLTMEGIIFVLRAAGCYAVAILLFPFRLLIRLWRLTLGAYLSKTAARLQRRRAEKYHEKMLAELRMHAECGWLSGNRKRKGGWRDAASKTHQKNDDRFAERQDLSDADRCVCHCLFCDQNDAEQQAQARERGIAKANRRGKAKGGRSAI